MVLTDLAGWESTLGTGISMQFMAALKQFELKGYCIFPGSVPDAICDNAIRSFESKYLNSHYEKYRDRNGHFPKLVNGHAASKEIARVFSSNKLALGFADLLFGCRAGLYTSLFFQRGSSQDMHIDAPYFRTIPENRYLGVWTALEKVDFENGPLKVCEGGHRVKGPEPNSILEELVPQEANIKRFEVELWNRYQSELMIECEKIGASVHTVCLDKGDTLVWHPRLPHGGAEILDYSRTRYSMVSHVVPSGTLTLQIDKFFKPERKVSFSETLVNWLLWRVTKIHDRRWLFKRSGNFQIPVGSEGLEVYESL